MSDNVIEVSTQSQNGNAKPKAKYVKHWRPDNREEVDKANWDTNNTEQFLNCVIHEIKEGNRMGQYLNTRGYNGLIKNFYKITGKYHDARQFKNRYDALKNDWAAWNQLRDPKHGATGLGFDNEKKTYTTPDCWWEKMIAMNKGCQKFRSRGLEHVELLDRIFEKSSSTGKTQWTPGEDLPSEPTVDLSAEDGDGMPDNEDYNWEESYQFNNDVNETNNLADDSEVNNVSTKKVGNKRHAKTSDKKDATRGPRRISASGKLAKTFDRLVDAFENQGNEVVVIKPQTDTVEATIPNCLKKLKNLPGVVVGDKVYIMGTKLITDAPQREVFMEIPTDEVRVTWIKSFLPPEKEISGNSS